MEYELCSKEQMYCFFAEFGATEESVNTDLKYIKEWLKQQPHLPNIEDDEFLTNLLLRCKNKLEKMKNALENYYTLRSEMSWIFENRNVLDKDYEQLLRDGYFTSLRKLTPEGYRVLVLRLLDESVNFIPDPKPFLRSVQTGVDVSVKSDPIRAMIVIIDFRHVTMAHFSQIPSLLPKLIFVTMKMLPIRIHAYYVLNLTPAAVPFLNLTKSMMKKKMADKIEIFDKDDVELVSVIPKEVLPAIYGGNDVPLKEHREIYIKYIQSYSSWFVADEKNKADLSKKPTDSTDSNGSLFGVDGSFRKLSVD